MYEGDISLDKNKQTVCEKGDIVLTQNDKNHFINLFNSKPNSWFYDKSFGLDLNKYFGELYDYDDNDILDKIRNEIKTAFNNLSIQSTVNIYKLSNTKLSIFISLIYNIDNEYEFNIELDSSNRKITFIENATNSIETTTNKYKKRRG